MTEASRPSATAQKPAALLLLGSLLLLSGCGRHGKGAPQGGAGVPPSQTRLARNVELTRVTQEPLTFYVETVGSVEPEYPAEVYAGIAGTVEEVLVREGQYVEAGSVLAKIDPVRYQTALEVAKANVARARANVELQKEMERFALGAGVGSTREEKAKMTLTARVADAELASSTATREVAELNMARSSVRAPFAGQVNQRKLMPGMYVEEKTILATMSDLSKLRIVTYIPERAERNARELLEKENARRSALITGSWLASTHLPWVGLAGTIIDAEGLAPSAFEVEFTLRALPRQKFTGRIFYLSTDAQRDTRLFECKAEMFRRGSNIQLRPGYSAKVKVPMRSTSAALIPEESVRAGERGDVVYRPTARSRPDGTKEWVAEEVVVELGFRRPGWVEVTNGVRPGDWVVRKGAEALEKGTPLNIPPAQVRELTK